MFVFFRLRVRFRCCFGYQGCCYCCCGSCCCLSSLLSLFVLNHIFKRTSCVSFCFPYLINSTQFTFVMTLLMNECWSVVFFSLCLLFWRQIFAPYELLSRWWSTREWMLVCCVLFFVSLIFTSDICSVWAPLSFVIHARKPVGEIMVFYKVCLLHIL